ncbi:MAG: FtsQ-type POTRA domain-containing protein [Verrucomicrobia bacterium]|nr:FtsQ-type POTRA domain-containing protein [Verrucomicrobiota bacterium]
MLRLFFVVAGTVVGLVLAGGGAYALVRHLHNSAEYVVHHIEVEGVSLLTADEVLKSAALEPEKPILSYNIRKARQVLLAEPMIREATVTRRLPDTIVVRVLERTPVARLALNNSQCLVDRDGFLLTDTGAQATLPVIVGVYVDIKDPAPGMQIRSEKLEAGLLVVALCKESPVLTEIGIVSVNVLSLGNVKLLPAPGPRVLPGAVVELGEGGFGKKLARLAVAIAHSEGKQLRRADFTRDRLPSFKFE